VSEDTFKCPGNGRFLPFNPALHGLNLTKGLNRLTESAVCFFGPRVAGVVLVNVILVHDESLKCVV
jgi:hypothetical protein